MAPKIEEKVLELDFHYCKMCFGTITGMTILVFDNFSKEQNE